MIQGKRVLRTMLTPSRLQPSTLPALRTAKECVGAQGTYTTVDVGPSSIAAIGVQALLREDYIVSIGQGCAGRHQLIVDIDQVLVSIRGKLLERSFRALQAKSRLSKADMLTKMQTSVQARKPVSGTLHRQSLET